jgi:hypothetical protein
MAISTLATRKRNVAGKLETTQGTAISIAAADGTLPFFNPALKYDIPINKRPSPGSASQMAGVPGARSGEFTGQSHVYNAGSGTDPIWASTWLAACGMVGSAGAYSFITGSSSANTLTIGLYQAGRLKSIAGAAGTAVIKGTAGNPLTIDWRFLGKWVAPSATAIIAPTYVTIIAAALRQRDDHHRRHRLQDCRIRAGPGEHADAGARSAGSPTSPATPGVSPTTATRC